MSDSTEQLFVGVDIGGTYSRLAIVDTHGRVLADRTTKTPTERDGEDLIVWLDKAFHECRWETDSYPAPEAMGVAVPGVLEPGRSAVIRAVNLPCIEGLPIRDRLVERTGIKTFVDCDSVAAAWAEYCARERAPKRMAYVSIGTGVGVAVILDGQVVRHTNHGAGHLGHLICDTSIDATVCACGWRGCLESCVGGPALERAAGEAGLSSILGDIEIAYQEGDRSAAEFIEDKARLLVHGLTNIVHIFAASTIVIGGGVIGALPSLAHRAATFMKESRTALTPDGLHVDLGSLGHYTGVVGAALLAAENVRSSNP